MLFGREKECQFITGLMNGRKNIIIYGEEGTGKSAIIHETVSRRKAEKLLYSHSSKTLREFSLDPQSPDCAMRAAAALEGWGCRARAGDAI